ncbi:MAG: inorganic phosphate transporter [Vicinamibacterales bacterium]
MAVVLLAVVVFLAFSNGANDNAKGVASLYGSGTLRYRGAIAWATATTFAGSMAATFVAAALLQRFTGKGLVPDALAATDAFACAVAAGAGVTVILATRLGFPVSTTHALTGAMVGSGWLGAADRVDVGVLGRSFVLPLVLSPILAIAFGAGLYLVLRHVRLRAGIDKAWCVCVGETTQLIAIARPASTLMVDAVRPPVTVRAGTTDTCAQQYTGRVLGVDSEQLMNVLHVTSAGIVSFARGLNDTPKMAALLLVLPSWGAAGGMLTVAAAIALGGLLSARRVAETMSHDITSMNHGQGLSANLATACLVIGASTFGWPVSTTHVSVGSLFGIGLTTRQANTRVMRNILLSWLVTLPCAALVSAAVSWAIGRVS